MTAASATVRRAVPADRDLILAWANDPDTRMNSFRSAPISSADHQRWFASQLGDPGVRIWLLEDRGEPVAQVRYARAGGVAEVGITVARAARGKGYGTAILRSTAEPAARELGVATLVALVFPRNAASQRIFEKAGYVQAGDEVREGQSALRYEWRVAR